MCFYKCHALRVSCWVCFFILNIYEIKFKFTNICIECVNIRFVQKNTVEKFLCSTPNCWSRTKDHLRIYCPEYSWNFSLSANFSNSCRNHKNFKPSVPFWATQWIFIIACKCFVDFDFVPNNCEPMIFVCLLQFVLVTCIKANGYEFKWYLALSYAFH